MKSANRLNTFVSILTLACVAAPWRSALARSEPAATAAEPSQSRPSSGPALESLDALLEPIRAKHNVPALAAAFVRPEGTVAAGAVGVRKSGGTEAVTLDDRFHIGSCTKAMTATLIAILVERGKLNW